MIVYVNDNYDQVLEYPRQVVDSNNIQTSIATFISSELSTFYRHYLYPNQWNKMHFSARFVEMLDHTADCSTRVIISNNLDDQPRGDDDLKHRF